MSKKNKSIYVIGFILISLPVFEVKALDEVEIVLSGEITAECSISQTLQSITLGELSRAGNENFALQVQCNAPFQYDVESVHGGLQLVAEAETNGFTSFLPYEFSTYIPTDTGLISDNCSSQMLKTGFKSCPLSNSGNGVAMPSNAVFTLAWQSSELPLLAGDYQDQITISFAVQP